ncbi:MAG: type IV pilin N-terminal domain-containing protein [Thermoplasmata archaeon]|nr:type IV pilin N-terminal domain-containing protein [Thermoplasmata archaeon]
MKANRKFVNEKEAVSAVIGVILMVAITVAIAATVYVYVSGMLGGTTGHTPAISCLPDNTNDKLVVQSCEAGVSWSDVNISITNSTSTYYTTKTGTVTAGDEIDLSSYGSNGESVTVTFRYTPTNTLMGTWTVVV